MVTSLLGHDVFRRDLWAFDAVNEIVAEFTDFVQLIVTDLLDRRHPTHYGKQRGERRPSEDGPGVNLVKELLGLSPFGLKIPDDTRLHGTSVDNLADHNLHEVLEQRPLEAVTCVEGEVHRVVRNSTSSLLSLIVENVRCRHVPQSCRGDSQESLQCLIRRRGERVIHLRS